MAPSAPTNGAPELIFHEIREPIDSVDLRGASVFEIGYGRGESARYMFKEKGIIEYLGVDFSEDAYQLARETLSDVPTEAWRLEVVDVLPFMQMADFQSRFHAVFMLDTIEHIPRVEVERLLPLIMKALKIDGRSLSTRLFMAWMRTISIKAIDLLRRARRISTRPRKGCTVINSPGNESCGR